MVYVAMEAQKDLEETGYKIAYAYPKSFNELPVVSYYTINDTPVQAFDKEFAQQASIQVDVWTHEDSEPLSGEMCTVINSTLRQKGWIREYSSDVPDSESYIHHHTMRFSKFFKEE